jgi:monothiol glutaredoxin
MKGTPELPQCGFSSKASSLLKSTGVNFSYVNVLAAPFIMEKLPEVSNFPTFPQLFINGEIIGGSDIIEEMLNSGELAPLLEEATA